MIYWDDASEPTQEFKSWYDAVRAAGSVLRIAITPDLMSVIRFTPSALSKCFAKQVNELEAKQMLVRDRDGIRAGGFGPALIEKALGLARPGTDAEIFGPGPDGRPVLIVKKSART